jgi:TRAP transporter 4TM/12TM fusion protein
MISGLLRYLGPGQTRMLGAPEHVTVTVLGAGCVALMLPVVLGMEAERNLVMFLFLASMLTIAFLCTTGGAHRPTERSWWAWGLSALTWASCIYFIGMRGQHEMRWPMVSPLTAYDMAAAVTLILLVLEATRRTIGMTLVTIVGLFLAYAAWGHLLEGSFSHRPLTLTEIIDHLVFTTNGVLGPALSVATFLVFIFVTFGAILDRFGGGDFFFDLSTALVGQQPGGPAKVAVISSGLYGTISGSPTADVVTTGTFTIPVMVRLGYRRVYAGAIEAVASTGGSIMPPVMGSAAFLMSDFTNIDYADIAKASVFTALLYYLALFTATHCRAKLDNLGSFSRDQIKPLAAVLRANWFFFVPIAVLVWFVFTADRPTYGAGLAILVMIAIGTLRLRFSPRVVPMLITAAADGARRTSTVAVACAVAGLVVGALTITDLSGKFSSMLFSFAPDQVLFVLLITMVVTIILGMGMPTPATYVLAAVLAAPPIVALGVPMLAAHLFIVYYASMSAITPPVAVAAFAAASIAKANPLHIAALGCRLGIVAFILPYAFIFRSALLLEAPLLEIAGVVVSATLGVLALAIGSEGGMNRKLGWPERSLLILGGLGLLYPDVVVNLVGAVLLAGGALFVFRGAPAQAR